MSSGKAIIIMLCAVYIMISGASAWSEWCLLSLIMRHVYLYHLEQDDNRWWWDDVDMESFCLEISMMMMTRSNYWRTLFKMYCGASLDSGWWVYLDNQCLFRDKYGHRRGSQRCFCSWDCARVWNSKHTAIQHRHSTSQLISIAEGKFV